MANQAAQDRMYANLGMTGLGALGVFGGGGLFGGGGGGNTDPAGMPGTGVMGPPSNLANGGFGAGMPDHGPGGGGFLQNILAGAMRGYDIGTSLTSGDKARGLDLLGYQDPIRQREEAAAAAESDRKFAERATLQQRGFDHQRDMEEMKQSHDRSEADQKVQLSRMQSAADADAYLDVVTAQQGEGGSIFNRTPSAQEMAMADAIANGSMKIPSAFAQTRQFQTAKEKLIQAGEQQAMQAASIAEVQQRAAAGDPFAQQMKYALSVNGGDLKAAMAFAKSDSEWRQKNTTTSATMTLGQKRRLEEIKGPNGQMILRTRLDALNNPFAPQFDHVGDPLIDPSGKPVVKPRTKEEIDAAHDTRDAFLRVVNDPSTAYGEVVQMMDVADGVDSNLTIAASKIVQARRKQALADYEIIQSQSPEQRPALIAEAIASGKFADEQELLSAMVLAMPPEKRRIFEELKRQMGAGTIGNN